MRVSYNNTDPRLEMLAGDAPLYTALENYLSKERAWTHTPGHGGRAYPLELLRLGHDLTELEETGSLYDTDLDGCGSPIARAEERASELFGSVRTVFSAGGCTLAIQAMLRCAANEGDKIIIGRSCHRAAVNACVLLGLEPVWAYPSPNGSERLPGRVTPNEIDRLLGLHPDAAAVYITSPDYYGCISDVGGISRVCDNHGRKSGRPLPLLVDNAHGTHLIAFDNMHPLSLGAAMTACSAHKTLPVLTGGAFLSCSDKRYASRLKPAMALFGSTSPSYPIMASLDIARAWMEREGGQAFSRLAGISEDIREHAVSCGFSLPEGECDPIRLTLLSGKLCSDANQAAGILRESGVEPEYSDSAAVILLLSPFNRVEDIHIIKNAVKTAADRLTERGFVQNPAPVSVAEIINAARNTKREMPLRQAALAPGRLRAMSECVGEISAETVCPCPPGIPLLMPGEAISRECAKLLERSGFNQLKTVIH